LIFDGISDLIFANGHFYATDAYGTPEVLSSPDGVRWKAHPTGFHQWLGGLAAGPQGLFALGSAGGILYSPWDLVLSGPEPALNGALRIHVTGPPGANVQLQRGTTLTDWADWQTVTLSNTPIQVEESSSAAVRHAVLSVQLDGSIGWRRLLDARRAGIWGHHPSCRARRDRPLSRHDRRS